MNKKIVIIILAIVCMLSVVVIGVFGSAVVNRNLPVSVKSVNFNLDDCKYIDEVNKVDPYIELIIDDDHPVLSSYQLKWSFNPENATNKEVNFVSSDIAIANVNGDGLIQFSNMIKSNKTITITITSIDGSKQDRIKIVIKYQITSSVNPGPDDGQFN